MIAYRAAEDDDAKLFPRRGKVRRTTGGRGHRSLSMGNDGLPINGQPLIVQEEQKSDASLLPLTHHLLLCPLIGCFRKR
jgi:hypothetical protein